MENLSMEKQDIRIVLRAVEILDQINRKYGCPHGENPLGIVIAAHQCAGNAENN